MKTTQQYLLEHGIKPSVQRMAIMDYLLKNHTHPTADEIYTNLQHKIPTLSKTTVYNTLKLFVKQGTALFIDIDEKNARFDGVMKAHAHFRCKQCGCIIDIPLPEIQQLLPKNAGFSIDEAYVNIKGLCKKCQMEKHKKRQAI